MKYHLTLRSLGELSADETYQMDEPDDNISDERDQITKIMKRNIFEDEETEQMKKIEHRYRKK